MWALPSRWANGGRVVADGRLVNAIIETYPDVSQFWKYDPQAFLAAPVYSRDSPPARNLE